LKLLTLLTPLLLDELLVELDEETDMDGVAGTWWWCWTAIWIALAAIFWRWASAIDAVASWTSL
jgi:hypothetical protein